MAQRTRDLHVESFRPLLPPAILLEELPLSETGASNVARGRAEVARILNGQDDRLVVVVGPCSTHDPAAARTTRTGSRRWPTSTCGISASSCASTSRSRAPPSAGKV